MTTWLSPDDDPFYGDRTPMAPPCSVDDRLARQVAATLRADAGDRWAHVSVEVQNGVAVLSGCVESEEDITTAAKIAHRTPGVRDVCMLLRTTRPTGPVDPVFAWPIPENGPQDGYTDRDRRMSGQQWNSAAVGACGVVAGWWLLCVLIVGLRWIGALIWCMGVAIVLGAVVVRRRRR